MFSHNCKYIIADGIVTGSQNHGTVIAGSYIPGDIRYLNLKRKTGALGQYQSLARKRCKDAVLRIARRPCRTARAGFAPWPMGPVAPWGPWGPVTPWGPGSPCSPGHPGGPGSPLGPMGPISPRPQKASCCPGISAACVSILPDPRPSSPVFIYRELSRPAPSGSIYREASCLTSSDS